MPEKTPLYECFPRDLHILCKFLTLGGCHLLWSPFNNKTNKIKQIFCHKNFSSSLPNDCKPYWVLDQFLVFTIYWLSKCSFSHTFLLQTQAFYIICKQSQSGFVIPMSCLFKNKFVLHLLSLVTSSMSNCLSFLLVSWYNPGHPFSFCST